MFDQMKQLNDMQKKAKDLQRQMETIKVEKKNSSGTLTVTVNGVQHVESMQIDPSWMTFEKRSALETSLCEILNEAFTEIQKKTAAQASSLMKDLKGFNIPGF